MSESALERKSAPPGGVTLRFGMKVRGTGIATQKIDSFSYLPHHSAMVDCGERGFSPVLLFLPGRANVS